MKHTNNFGAVRLLFATLVIVSHAPELVDGNRSRELLTLTFHTLSFGELAVDGFFLVSGYLVTASYFSSASAANFLMKRMLRIYPAFCVAWLVCMVLVAPVSGAGPWPFKTSQLGFVLVMMLNLKEPALAGAFHALHYKALDGAMWTIGYEFRCYLFLALAGALGLLQRRRLFLALTFAVMLTRFAFCARLFRSGFCTSPIGSLLATVFIEPSEFARYAAFFSVGVCYYLFRREIKYSRVLAACCVVGLFGFLEIGDLAELGGAVFGGYLCLFVALGIDSAALRQINNRADISYGMYLYAWPIQSLLILYCPGTSLWQLGVACFALAVCAGYASWRIIEAPALALKRRTAGAATQPA